MLLLRVGLALFVGVGLSSLGTTYSPLVSHAVADDSDSVTENTYIAPLDMNTSDEDVHEQASGGFDTQGRVVVQPEYYDSTQPDNTGSDSEQSDSSDSGSDNGDE